jgi:hypothetical protein
MRVRAEPKIAAAICKARRLTKRVNEIIAACPEADPDNIRHTLILLELPPLERLRRGLIRGRALAHKKAAKLKLWKRQNVFPASQPIPG